MSLHIRNKAACRAGFTLTEVLIAMSIFLVVSAAAMTFMLFNGKVQFISEQKLLINSDVRTWTNELVSNARGSNYFVLYQSFYDWQMPNGTLGRRDLNTNGTINANDRCKAGEEGNFLVFIYYQDPYYDSRYYDNIADNEPAINNIIVERIVAYWYAPNRNLQGENAIYMLDTNNYKGAGAYWTTPWGQTFPVEISNSTTIETLLPPPQEYWATYSGFDIVVNDLTGLTGNEYLFQNFENRSVLVKMKILHGNRAKRVTNTYNFTVTPRG